MLIGKNSPRSRLGRLLQLFPLSRLEGLPSVVGSNLTARHGPIQADSQGCVQFIGRHFPLVGIKRSVDQLIRVLSRMHSYFRIDSETEASFFLETLQLLRAVGCPGTGKSTLLRCIWGLLLDRIKEVRESDQELWKLWQQWGVDHLEARILAWGERPWVYLLSMERSGG